MAFWKTLTDATVVKLVEVLTPWFVGKPQDALIAFADEVATSAYDRAYDDIEVLYDFRSDIMSNAGASMVGTTSGQSVQDMLNNGVTLSQLNTAIATREPTIAAGTTAQYWRGDKTWQTLNKAAVGLGNVDNTSDANKPISTATQTALNGKENSIAAGTTAQYYRGDKTWQTLNTSAVPEGTNLYFTNARAITAPLTGYVPITGQTVAATDNVVTAVGKLQGQILNRVSKAGDTMTGSLTFPGGMAILGNTSGLGASEQLIDWAPNRWQSYSADRMWFGNMSIRVDGEVQSGGINSYRQVGPTYGTFWRNDGPTVYLLITASGDQYGSWSALRPFYVDLGSGMVTMANGAAVTGPVNVGGSGAMDIYKDLGLKVRSPALGNGLDIGASPALTGGTDPDVYFYQRNNGSIWWGTNNALRGKMLANGAFEWYYPIWAAGRMMVTDSVNTPVNPAARGIGMVYASSAAGDSGRIYSYDYVTPGYKNLIIEASTLFFYRGGAPGTGFEVNANGIYLNDGWYRSYGDQGWYNQTYGGGIYMTDTTYVRAYGGKSMAAVSFQVSSDAKLKDVIGPIQPRDRLNPVEFTWKKDGKKDFGFIAQEVQEVYPEAVGRVGQEGDEDSHLVVDYARLVAPLYKLVYELQDEVTELKEKLRDHGIS